MRTMLLIASGLLATAVVVEPAAAQRYHDGNRSGWNGGSHRWQGGAYRPTYRPRYHAPRYRTGYAPRYRAPHYYAPAYGYRPRARHNVVCRTSWWHGRRVENCRRTFY